MPNLAINLCLLALLSILYDDPPTQPLSLFSRGFSFAGSWDCRGTLRGINPHRANFQAATASGGTWLTLIEDDTKPATGYQASYWIGYHSQQHRLVEFDANIFAGATYSSFAWQVGVLTTESAESTTTAVDEDADRWVYHVVTGLAFAVDWKVRRTRTVS